MAEMEQAPGPYAGLTKRELEVLRLLAAGHTSKTIATRLGRSETAINELLRAARRKTGVGSSRELARLLAAQKNWDRNFDLSTPGLPGNQLAEPAPGGLIWSKGMGAMLVAMSVAAAGLLFAATPSALQSEIQPAAYTPAATQPPLAGSWSLDTSRVPEAERPQRVTITFRKAPDDKWTTLVEIVAPDGSTRHAESTAAIDGVPVPIRGNMDFIDTAALRQPAPDTLVMTLGKNGAPTSTRVYTVTKDGRSMTETIVWAGDRLPKLETTHFTRLD
jgi:DNA-binding CsgD family transcriptional regulator